MVCYCMKAIDEDHFQFGHHDVRAMKDDGGWDVKVFEVWSHDSEQSSAPHTPECFGVCDNVQ